MMEPVGEMMQEPPRETKSMSGFCAWAVEAEGWFLPVFEEVERECDFRVSLLGQNPEPGRLHHLLGLR